MEEMNVFYRAFNEYKKLVQDKDSLDLVSMLKQSLSIEDSLKTIEYNIDIELDWVEKIEEGTNFLEKAIREDRQFIREYGEVVPVEMVKSVDVKSITHLASHSELITKEPEEGEVLTPDSLYVVERLTDYAVYENRFLYMVLVYINNFINVKLGEIEEIGKKNVSKLRLKKDVQFSNRRLSYEVNLTDENQNRLNNEEDRRFEEILKRIKDQSYMVNMLMSTPIMREVAKTPLLKPPIVKTNVLRSDNNFKQVYDMYQYLVAYEKQGYTAKNIERELAPFSSYVQNDFLQSVLIQFRLTYQHVQNLTDQLKKEYLLQEEQRKLQEQKLYEQKIRELKKRIHNSGKTEWEYLLYLENTIKDIRDKENQLELANVALLQHQATITAQQEQLDLYNKELLEIKAKSIETEKAFNDTLTAVNKENERLLEQLTLISAEVKGLRELCGVTDETVDMSTEEGINQLEKEFIAFASLFKQKWTTAKKKIRNEILVFEKEKEKVEK